MFYSHQCDDPKFNPRLRNTREPDIVVDKQIQISAQEEHISLIPIAVGLVFFLMGTAFLSLINKIYHV